jgi:hypothetical protein
MGALLSSLPAPPEPAPAPISDLSGLFQIQKNYLTGIGTTDPSLTINVQNLQSQLDKLHTNFVDANITNENIFDHQNDMSKIVDTEKDRLLMKKQNIDRALESKRRAAELNESHRLRSIQYTKMVIVIIFTLLLFVITVLIGRYFTIIPSFIISLLSIVIIVTGIIICYIIYTDIKSRDKMNFNELDLNGTKILTPTEIANQRVEQGKAGNLLDSINFNSCIANDCCSTGTVFDASNSVCVAQNNVSGTTQSLATPINVPPGSSAFTTLSTIMNTGVKPNSPNESDSYVFI